MTTSFGAIPLKDANGVVTAGTTEADIQQIYGSLYSAGLISGGIVTTSASQMTYTVSAGVAAFPLVVDSSTPYKPQNQRTVLGPIPATTITVATGGPRDDYIYAQQLTPATDSDATVVVKAGPSLPARAVLLGLYRTATNSMNTNSTLPMGNIKYSIPYGASLGRLYQHTATANWSFTGRGTDGSGQFFLPTDRLVNISLTSTLSAVKPNGLPAVGFDNTAYCEAGYDIFLDDKKIITWTSPGLAQAWAEYYWSALFVVGAGPHTIKYERYKAQGPGNPFVHGDNSKGNDFVVQDVGPVP